MEVVLGEMKSGGSAELHSHSGNEQAIFVLEGTLLFQTGDDQNILCPGELMFIPKNARHAVKCVGGTARFLIVYSPPLSSGEKEVKL